MRFVVGVIVGVLLTIGTAYGVDQFHSRSGSGLGEGRRMVDWQAVHANLDDASANIKQAWTYIVGRSRDGEKKDADHGSGA